MTLLRLSRAPFTCRLCGRISSRSFASKKANESSGQSYIEEWQASIIKPAEFYESNSAPGLKRKNYFYNIDLQGRVFLGMLIAWRVGFCSAFEGTELTATLFLNPAEDTMPKNIATSIKNVEFLNFFFRQLRRVGPKHRTVLQELNAEDDYPFVSPCGLELNFVRGADLPIVFTNIQPSSSDGSSSFEQELGFGGSLVQTFQPDKLAMSPTTGRLYHELISASVNESSNRLTPLHSSQELEYGLIRSSVAVSLSESIVVGSDEEDDTLSGMEFHCSELDCTFPIKWLPLDARPGMSSMPFVEGIE